MTANYGPSPEVLLRFPLGMTVLDDVQVASPCDANWDAMMGDDRARSCHLCQLHVYNLSAMTTEEALDLIQQKEGTLCVRFYRRADGTVLTADCPIGVQRRLLRSFRFVAGVVAASLTLVGSVCMALLETPSRPQSPSNTGASAPGGSHQVVMGKRCFPADRNAVPDPRPNQGPPGVE